MILACQSKLAKTRFALRASKNVGVKASKFWLKNCMLTAICAIGAYAVRGLFLVVFFAERIHKTTGVPLVQRVARKLFIACFLLIERQKQLTQLHLELSIRHCRIAYLRRKLRDGGFEIAISSRLRLLEKTLDGSCQGHPAFRRGKRLASDLRKLAEGLEVKITHGAPMKLRETPPKVAMEDATVNEAIK